MNADTPRWRVLVTGSAGHLGEAVVRALRGEFTDEVSFGFPLDAVDAVVGLDLVAGPYTTVVGSVADAGLVDRVFEEHRITAVIHTATLHKPHVESHTRQQFVDTNVSGTLNLLEASVKYGVRSFVFTSTTSVYSKTVEQQASEAAGRPTWVTNTSTPAPKNIYGITKIAAEGLCALFMRLHALNVVVLRTSRFFHEPDDDAAARARFTDANIKTNEFLYRRVDVADIVSAHVLAMANAAAVVEQHKRTPQGIAYAPIFVVSALSPLRLEDMDALERGEPIVDVLRRRLDAATFAAVDRLYGSRGWKWPTLDRVYDSAATAVGLGWTPMFDFSSVCQLQLQRLDTQTAASGRPSTDPIVGSALAAAIGRKGYHGKPFEGSMDAIGQPFKAV